MDTAITAARADGTQSVQRAALLMRMIASHNRAGLRVVDLCRLTGLHRATVHRLLQCLTREGLIARNARTRNYHLGQLLYELGLTAAPAVRLEDICRTHLKALAEATRDMVFLTVRSGFDAVCVDRQEGDFPIRTYTLEIGTRRPLGIGAGSLSILSALKDDEITAIVEYNQSRLAAYNGLTARKLLRLVKQTQDRGFAVHDGAVSGARAIGLALYERSGAAFAGISVSAITSRMQESRWPDLTRHMRERAGMIQRALE